jgi:hypothetical protein
VLIEMVSDLGAGTIVARPRRFIALTDDAAANDSTTRSRGYSVT